MVEWLELESKLSSLTFHHRESNPILLKSRLRRTNHRWMEMECLGLEPNYHRELGSNALHYRALQKKTVGFEPTNSLRGLILSQTPLTRLSYVSLLEKIFNPSTQKLYKER